MKSCASVVALVLVTATPAVAQDYAFPRNPNIQVEYGTPNTPNLRNVHDRMRKLNILQTLQEFLSPVKLARPITVRMDQCGRLSVPYKQNGPVTICYEHINEIRNIAPEDGVIQFDAKRRLTANEAIAGGVARLMLYETAFGVFDSLSIPIWGRVDEAADNVTALIMLDFGEQLAWSSILGSAWYLAQRGITGTGFFTASTFNIQHSALKIIAYPDAELHPAEPGAPGVRAGQPIRNGWIGEQHIFPILVEQRAPRPVEVHGEPERERLEAEAVRRRAVDQPEA